MQWPAVSRELTPSQNPGHGGSDERPGGQYIMHVVIHFSWESNTVRDSVGGGRWKLTFRTFLDPASFWADFNLCLSLS